VKKFLSLLSVVLLGSSGSVKDNDFEYKYTVVANSNKVDDLMYMYRVKEKLIDKYEGLVFNINEKYHKQTIMDNLDYFDGKDYDVLYKNDAIYIVIGDGNGKSISGDLRRNSCDSKPVRVQFFFSKFFN
jgi:hypothetical protein